MGQYEILGVGTFQVGGCNTSGEGSGMLPGQGKKKIKADAANHQFIQAGLKRNAKKDEPINPQEEERNKNIQNLKNLKRAEDYAYGKIGIKPNYDKAIEYYQKATQDSDILSAIEYFIEHAETNQLINYWATIKEKINADRDDKKAAKKVAKIYAYGTENVAQNVDKAIEYYQKANPGSDILNAIEYFIENAKTNKLINYWTKIKEKVNADRGDKKTAEKFAKMYAYGTKNIVQNADKAIKYYQKANPRSDILNAIEYFIKNAETSRLINYWTKIKENVLWNLHKKAASAGDKDSCLKFAKIYAYDIENVVQNFYKAIKYYQNANPGTNLKDATNFFAKHAPDSKLKKFWEKHTDI